jgi:DinB superfamily/Pentapeptide repeats (8 copies)
MATDDKGAGEFRGASFTSEDFTGAKFRDCDLRKVKITDSWLVDVSLSGLVGNLVVNDVDVTAYVEGELDKRHPERVQLRAMRTASDYRAMWHTIENLWSQTVARAGRLPSPALPQRVDDEWSFAETLRHLVFATDKWAGHMILGKPMPYHRLGLACTATPTADTAGLGIDPDARPPLEQVLEVRGTRMAMVRGVVDRLTDDDMERVCPRLPAPGYPEETYTVGRCLNVIMDEECEHRRYAVRDLAVLETDQDDLPASGGFLER